MMAALYLLTADLRLWNLSKRHVGKISINFADIRLKNIHENGYALFCCAKDLCLGTKHLTVADLADTDLIPPKLFELICNAMAIRRFGLGAIKTTERTNNQCSAGRTSILSALWKTPASYLRIKPMDKRQAEIQICLSRLSCRRMYFPCC